MKKGTLKFPARVQVSELDNDCVLTFGGNSMVLDYDAAFELAIQLSKFIQACDEQEATSEAPTLAFVVH